MLVYADTDKDEVQNFRRELFKTMDIGTELIEISKNNVIQDVLKAFTDIIKKIVNK